MSATTQTAPGRGPRLTAAERREQLLDATLALAVRDGFHAVSIDAVAREAGITRPVVYGHFTDLRGLLNALSDREQARALAQMDEVIPTELHPVPPRDALSGALRSYLAVVAAAPDTWRLVLLPLEGTPALLRERIATDRAAIRGHIATLLRAGLERDGVGDPVDVELAAHLLQAVAEEAARLVLTDPQRWTVARLGAFADVLLAPLA